jgi:hypothetical protein
MLRVDFPLNPGRTETFLDVKDVLKILTVELI